MNLDAHFPRYTDFDPLVPVWCVTPNEGRAIHRFFDTSPISPSGRFLAVTRLSSETDYPKPGELAQVCVIDLETGEDRVVAETAGWEPQLGANINWGGTDHELVFQDVDAEKWEPKIVVFDPIQNTRRDIPGGYVYSVSRDGRYAVGAHPAAKRRTQEGYGIVIPDELVPRQIGASDSEGLWLTDLQSGERKLIVSIKQAIDNCTPAFEIDDPDQYEIYGFQGAFNPQTSRIFFSLRFYPKVPRTDFYRMKNRDISFTVLTCKLDGSDICNALPTSAWAYHGHHTTWHPDGEHLTLNLRLAEKSPMQFVSCRYDGTDLKPLIQNIQGSGHPNVHPNCRHIITDTYQKEPMSFGDGTIPLRWIDMQHKTEQVAVRINSLQPVANPTFRVDPHPTWDRSYRYITFNAFVDGTRKVFIADFQPLL